MTICIPPELIDKVKKIVSEQSSISRDKQLTDLFGSKDTAKEINTLYEKSLLLKNQDTAIDKFISNFTELGQKAKFDLKEKIKTRLVNRTDKIQDDELLAIAQDIFNKKYKLDIPLEDVQKLNAIKRDADALAPAMEGTPAFSEERLAYGRKQVELKNAVGDLKNPNDKLGFRETAKALVQQTGERFKDKDVSGKIGEGAKLVKDVLTSAVYKSVQASADISYSLRQGFKVLTKDPKTWAKNWVDALEPLKKIGSKEAQQKVADEWAAGVVSHPLYEQAIDSKLALGVIEDYFPTTLAEKIPIIGNVFKSSNEAFTIFSQGSRLGLFENMYNKAVKEGVEITPELTKSIAEVANSITGRGSLGKLESVSGTINKILYSGRYVKSAIDTFTMPFNQKLDPFARKEAMKSSIATLSTIATLMYTASLFTDVETDPRSSKFGKMKIPGSKDRWIDLTAGIGSYITLASRFSGKSKSSTTGKITKLNERDKSGNLKFNTTTIFDVVTDFLANKTSPALSTAIQFAKGRDYTGKKPTIGSSALNLATPISVGNIYESFASEDSKVAKFIAGIADILGASQTDYTRFNSKK